MKVVGSDGKIWKAIMNKGFGRKESRCGKQKRTGCVDAVATMASK